MGTPIPEECYPFFSWPATPFPRDGEPLDMRSSDQKSFSTQERGPTGGETLRVHVWKAKSNAVKGSVSVVAPSHFCMAASHLATVTTLFLVRRRLWCSIMGAVDYQYEQSISTAKSKSGYELRITGA